MAARGQDRGRALDRVKDRTAAQVAAVHLVEVALRR